MRFRGALEIGAAIASAGLLNVSSWLIPKGATTPRIGLARLALAKAALRLSQRILQCRLGASTS
ncbi:hypothetical protein [Methylocystis bryophila]|uniref:Uncharacterized protein n=1 Tax=Methylocystis bryophila TaxID=655015 RepID=A0A1W6MW77_9HYPH|nr:hypothetical protein [Methylocystis bryophila]ARN81843.1 hypothetical protein B1812_12975 [Methylocystis bryophila]BDV37917.1 hypothetical protein DSM21852_11700 [Methylocystis bryophila]